MCMTARVDGAKRDTSERDRHAQTAELRLSALLLEESRQAPPCDQRHSPASTRGRLCTAAD